jgi:hypothetical protein
MPRVLTELAEAVGSKVNTGTVAATAGSRTPLAGSPPTLETIGQFRSYIARWRIPLLHRCLLGRSPAASPAAGAVLFADWRVCQLRRPYFSSCFRRLTYRGPLPNLGLVAVEKLVGFLDRLRIIVAK